ncbi:MAG: UbiX family flavin prenyltransferase [Armatimonadota bacterium]
MVDQKRLVVALSGASGMLYARRLLEVLPRAYDRIYLTATDNAFDIIRDELQLNRLEELLPVGEQSKFCILSSTDLHSPPASGSYRYDGMVVVPCSVGVVGRIASGISNDLVTRAADVCLKEGRKLVLVLRETPLNLVHLKNLSLLADAGATILPAAPAFYNKPLTVSDLVDYVVDKILCALGVGFRLVREWGE